MYDELEDEELHKIRKLFAACDEDGSGSISFAEAKKLFTEINKNLPNKEKVRKMMETDVNSDGTITFHEFINLYKKLVLTRARELKIREAFKICDLDQNGNISVSELKKVMIEVGEHLSDDQLNEMIKEVDLNGDGIINLEEFINLMGLK